MNNFVKMDIAIEFLADKISKTTTKYFETNDEIYRNELNNLINERDKIYEGDLAIIDKAINIYGKELVIKLNEVL